MQKTGFMTALMNFIVVFLMSISSVYAQETGDNNETLEKEFAEDYKREQPGRVWNFAWENDSFGDGSDQNYTNGVRASYINLDADFPKVLRAISEYLPMFEVNETSFVTYSFGHNMYTPRNIRRRTLNPNDRPYAAHLYGSVGMATLKDNRADEVELSVGIIGPEALGEPIQREVHQLVRTTLPKGWEHQLDTEPAVTLGWQRVWPEYRRWTVDGLAISVDPHIGTTVGNVYTFANTGVTSRISPKGERFHAAPARVRPGLPGASVFEIPEKEWGWSLFAGVDGRAIARNIFLDGNTFSDSHSVDKNYFVADLNAGISLIYKKTRISYTLVHRTEEFEGQDDRQIFGSISISRQF